ncbi:MAG TPA: radical SAM protein, partial [Actinobacteria bacterium]|nr:radical SAM protein [Actinomycetota bacterium]
CLGRSIESIEGLIHRDGDDVIFNGERPFQHLNDVAFPKYHRFEMDKYLTRMVPLVTSRGCPYSCIYCPVEKAIGKRFRLRNAENVVAEIEHWVDQGDSQYLILDDNFTLKTGRVEEICELIGAKGLDELDIGLPNGVRADRISRDLLKKMRSVGFSRLAFGVEAGNDKVLANINKGEKMIHIESAIADACDLGFKVTLFFIIGSPGETWADFMDSISLARRYPIDEARFYNLIPFPGTKLYDWVKDKGYLVRDYNEYLNSASHFVNSPCFETPDLSLSERKRAFKLASKTSRQVRRRSLTRKLSRLGPFAGPLAAAYTTSIVQRLSQASAPFKRLKSALNRDSDHLYQRKQENKLRNEARGMSRESSESQDGDRRTIV